MQPMLTEGEGSDKAKFETIFNHISGMVLVDDKLNYNLSNDVGMNIGFA